MSVSSTTNRLNYTGNGAVDTYAYTFRVFDDDDLTVTVRDTDDVETTLTKTTHYTVTGVGELSGGNVALVNGAFDWIDGDGDLKSNYILTIRRVLDLIQETDIRNQGTFFPETHEDQFDKFIMIDQQQQDEINRSVKFPETIPSSSFDNDLPASLVGEINAVLMTNDTGDGWEAGPTATAISGAQAAATAAAASATAADSSATAAASSATSAANTVSQFLTGVSATIANNQLSATNITAMTVDAADYSSCRFDIELYRFTDSVFSFASGFIFLHRKNSVWVLEDGIHFGDDDSTPAGGGITYSVTEAAGIAQVQYVSSNISGSGYSGTIKFRKVTFDA